MGPFGMSLQSPDSISNPSSGVRPGTSVYTQLPNGELLHLLKPRGRLVKGGLGEGLQKSIHGCRVSPA